MNNVIYGLFQQSRANNSKVTSLIRPEFELIWDLMPVLVTCKFDKDLINNKHASVETSFPIIVYEKFFQCSRVCNWIEWSNQAGIWTQLSFYAHLGYLQVWRRSDKNDRKAGDTISPIVSQQELLVAMTTTVLIQSAPKHNAAFPTPHWCYT